MQSLASEESGEYKRKDSATEDAACPILQNLIDLLYRRLSGGRTAETEQELEDLLRQLENKGNSRVTHVQQILADNAFRTALRIRRCSDKLPT